MVSYATAEPQFIEVNGTRFAYLRFGSAAKNTVPLVFLQHFRGTFDHWDPQLIDPISTSREVILLDNSGVGKSNGTVPGTYAKWADNVSLVVKALGIPQIDLFGFSMGGFAAQMVALNYPTLVRKLILAGTGPSAGEGVEGGDPAATGRLAAASNDEEERGGFLETSYSLTPAKQTLGDKWWKLLRWTHREYASEGSYDRLHEIKVPVLVANGDNDIIIPTVNSWVMFKRLSNANAHFHLYPDVGHGFLNEYAGQFSRLINQFLDN
ncbi:hypothetical protein ACSS6W_005902 [Trichoderma asperelloides]|uniref:Proline iminopeptidase PfmaB n=1 Tax=Trichoderma asperellum TaxID=101201 RepID=A0A6V8R377_TRIAP|nr:proline iminopeptidase PfmaB [Trichoderma asperellum]